jgi:serine/threonine-protein kinase
MEHLEGQSLGDRLFEEGRLTPEESLRTLLPIADALVAAHARGIVHRDLKPENIFLVPEGNSIQPKLLDFGIAKLGIGFGRRTGSLTQAGALVGSPAYVSPEQAECRDDIGEHTDVWSFSVVLYECLTGKVPFESEDYPELFQKISEEAPESILDHGVGNHELWDIIRRGLAKNPAERWPTMHLLGQMLASWLTARGVREDITGVLIESKWAVTARSEPAQAPDTLEPSSFVRRIQRNPALATTQLAPVRSALRRYAIYVGAGIAALVVLAFLLAGSGSPSPTVAADQVTPLTAPTVVEPGVTIPAPGDKNGPALAAPTARPHAASNEASRHAAPATSALLGELEKIKGASTPPAAASASASPSTSPSSEQGELLDPY